MKLTVLFPSGGLRRRCAASVVGLCAGLCGVAQAWALDCPEPQAAGQAGVIVETPEQIRALSNVFAAGGADAQIAVTVAELRKRHPDARSAALINYLITAYCPSVRDNANLSDSDKDAKLKAFAERVRKVVY